MLEERADSADGGENLFLTFLVGKDILALAVDYVHEIVQLQPIVPVPQQQGYMKGVMNLRGDIIPVLDLKRRLGNEDTEATPRTCIIVTDIGGERAGMVVDTVYEVMDIPQEEIVPFSNDADAGSCICAMVKRDKDVYMILDCDAVLGQGESGLPGTSSPALVE